MDESINISFHSNEDVKPRSPNGEYLIYEWTISDLKTLCSRIKDASLRLNKAVNAPYNKTENRLNWETIAFDAYGAEECRTKWQQLCTNIRTFRTMAELVGDAEQWLQKGPRKAKEARVMGKAHPDKPSRPPTIFFKFLMEQLPKVKKKYPDLTHRQIVSKIGEMYKTVTPKKKNQLKAEFLEEQEVYRKRLEAFYDAHPDVAPSKGPTNATPKGTSGLAFFVAERMKDPRNSDVSKEDLRAKWLKLKDEKKIPFIEMALDAHRKNAGAAHFIAKPSKDVLSKDERIVYDRFLGKPEKPPSTGFALFKNIANATKFKDMDVAQRSQAAQEAWNALSKPDQYKFNNEAKILKQQYDTKMEAFTKRLAEREQKLAENSDAANLINAGSDSLTIGNGAPPAKRLKAEVTPTSSPKKSTLKVVVPGSKRAPKKLTALTWYQESGLDEWKQVNPQLSEVELRSAMADEFAGLSEKKKEKWARKAEKENARRGLN